jgi:hypothetical protein
MNVKDGDQLDTVLGDRELTTALSVLEIPVKSLPPIDLVDSGDERLFSENARENVLCGVRGGKNGYKPGKVRNKTSVSNDLGLHVCGCVAHVEGEV